MKTLISMTGYRRPLKTQAVLESLEACGNLHPVRLRLEQSSFEHHDAFDVIKARRWRFPIEVSTNSGVLGISLNTHKVIKECFDAGAEFVIHLEDDTQLLPGAIEYFQWAAKNLEDNKRVATVCAFSSNISNDFTDKSVILQPWFGCWAWGTWASRWSDISRNWGGDRRGFGRHVCGYQLSSHKLQAYPAHSLCVNIGFDGGAGATNAKIAKTIPQILASGTSDWQIDQVVDRFPVFREHDIKPHEFAVAAHWINQSCNGLWTYGENSCDGSINDSPWAFVERRKTDDNPVLRVIDSYCRFGFMTRSGSGFRFKSAYLSGSERLVLVAGNEFDEFLTGKGFKMIRRHVEHPGNGIYMWERK